MVIIHHSLRTLEVGVGAPGGDAEEHGLITHHEDTFPYAVLRVWISITCKTHHFFSFGHAV